MALKSSTGLRDKWLSGTNSLRQIMEGGILRIYTGSNPSSPDDAISGSLICTFAAATFGTGSTAGTMAISNTVSGTCGIAGTAGYFRLSEAGDNGSASTTIARLEGVVGKVDSAGADLTLVNTILLNGQVLSVTTATLGIPIS